MSIPQEKHGILTQVLLIICLQVIWNWVIRFLSHKLFSHWVFAMTDVQGIESFNEVTGIYR